jgi:signal recognition particle GTPase
MLGVETTRAIIDELTAQVSRKQLANMAALYQALQQLMVQRLEALGTTF